MSAATAPLAIAHQPETSPARVGLTIEEMKTIARALSASGYFDTISRPEQAFAKILYGAEIGIGPMAAIAGVHIVEGKPTLDASLVRARIKQSGRYDYKIRRADSTGAAIEFFERGESLGIAAFDEKDATVAGLIGKSNWKKYARAMYLARATTEGARTYCPDVFNGAVYTPEEVGARDVVDVAEPLPPSEPKDAIAGAVTQSEPEPDTEVTPEQTQALPSSSGGKTADTVGGAEGEDDAAITAWIETWFAKHKVPSDDVDLLEITGAVSSDGGVAVTYDWRQLRIEEKRELVRRFAKKRGFSTRG